MRHRLLWALFAVASGMVATACGAGGSGASGGETRRVLVDYVHDEVASSFIAYFPGDVRVHPGDTVVFKQEWTGEPHSVTMGRRVDKMMGVVGPLFEEYGDSEEEPPKEVLETFYAAMESLPPMIGEGNLLAVNQNAGQPCYLDRGLPPEDPATPCDDAEQVQPPFDGRQSYYNSGFIPYEGPQGNEFTVPLADDIEPGTYNYYCNLHGPFQAGTITVVAEDEPIPSQEEVSRQARAEIDAMAEPLAKAFEAAPREGKAEIFGTTAKAPLAGWGVEVPGAHASINEFIPAAIEVAVGEPLEWSFVGGHTVSFDVPEYFAQVTVEDDGTVVFNEDASRPIDSPPLPEPEGPPEGEGGGEDAGESGGAESEGEEGAAEAAEGSEAAESEGEGPPPPEPVVIDAGTWDGEGFRSSGLMWEGTYRMRFSQPGRYPYACLIHPQMVGTVEVR